MHTQINKRTALILVVAVWISTFCFLPSMVVHGYAEVERDELLIKKFAPILVLTKNPTVRSRIIVNPEPVEIMGAESVSNVRVSVWDLGSNFVGNVGLMDGWNPPVSHSVTPGVNFSLNHFAFISSERFTYAGTPPGNNINHGIYFLSMPHLEYPGIDKASWNAAYLRRGGDDAQAGWRFRNTVYARVFERTDSSDGRGSVFITYFSFYPFNDWENNHEGDWQKINVMVTSRDPDTAEVYGIDYLFHGKSITYYNISESVSSINVEESISPVGGDHPVVYVSAGGHGQYPTPGDYPSAGAVTNNDNLTPNGLVLHPEIVESNTAIAQSYDLVMLPQPDRSLANMGLEGNMSWLGADMAWGTPNVPSPGDFVEKLPTLITPQDLVESNDAAVSPFSKGSWGKIRYDDPKHDKYDRAKIPSDYESFHNFPIVGNVTWSGTVSLRGDVVVFPGAALTVDAGTVIEFEHRKDIHQFPGQGHGVDKWAEIFVYGTLTANGTTNSPITFQRSGNERSPDAWGGIRKMKGGSVDLRHTVIQDMAPPAPGNLTGQAGAGQVTLSWDDPYPDDPTITKWEYSHKAGSAKWSNWKDAKISAAATTCTVKNLAHGVLHRFKVRAVNASGGGPAAEDSVALMTVTYDASSYSVTEGGGPVEVAVRLQPATDRAVSIPITVTNGTAEAGDYTLSDLTSGQGLPFAVGDDLNCFTIEAASDADTDSETATLGLGSALPAGVRAGSPATAALAISEPSPISGSLPPAIFEVRTVSDQPLWQWEA